MKDDIMQEIHNSLNEIKADIKRLAIQPISKQEYNKTTASKYLEISIPTLERYMQRGFIRYIERSGRVTFTQQDLDAFLVISPTIKYKTQRSQKKDNINNKE